ncbi:translational activator of GCN4 [Actinomortierella ambigua]|uniref:eIF-2-alpha kinase activator GCN1 n=1 Tax=Actinomortierella ambigua TaxID=1343610 RepID=A0A9P6U040_9FUNG|nr:translational activator of GCN4 [Actinomortierella ambigua]
MAASESLTSHDPSENTWQEYLRDTVLPSVTISSLNERSQFLHLLLVRVKRKDLPVELLPALIRLLLLSYPRYNDRASRLVVLDVLKELNNWNSEEFLKAIVPRVQQEVDKLCVKNAEGANSSAPGSRFVFLTWVNLLVTCALAHESKTAAKLLISCQAVLLDGLVGEFKKSFVSGALSDTRRCLRKNSSSIPLYLEHLTTASTTPTFQNAVLLGTVVDVALRLKSKAAAGKQAVETFKDAIIKYYVSNLISSKQAVPARSATAFNDFFRHFVSLDTYKASIQPTAERSVLRAPEIVLGLLVHLMKALSFDPSPIFSSLQDPLLSSLRSSNESTRSSAVSLFKQLAGQCKQEEDVLKVVTEMTKQLTTGKVTSPDHRGLYFDCLGSTAVLTSDAVSTKVVQGLTTMTAKETNEGAVKIGIEALVLHLGNLLASEKTFPEVAAATKAGVDALASARGSLRKTWAAGVGSIIWNAAAPTHTLAKHFAPFLPPLIAAYNKIQAAPLTYKDGPLDGYVAVAVASRLAEIGESSDAGRQFVKSAMATSPKPSLVLFDKVYTKLTTAEEGVWFVHALESLITDKELSEDAKAAVGTAFVYAASCSPFAEARREAYSALRRAAQRAPESVATLIRQAVERWVLDLEVGAKDSTTTLAASTMAVDPHVSTYRLAEILAAVTSYNKDADQMVMSRLMVELIVLAHHEAIASPTKKYDWMTLAQRAHLDPGHLVEDYQKRVEELIMDAASLDSTSPQMYKAAMSAISSLVFIAPDTMISMFIGHIVQDLDSTPLETITEQDVAIWKHPEGELYVDVLRGMKKATPDRSRVAFDEKKYQREVSKALNSGKKPASGGAAAASSGPKLTRDEQASVDAQLAKESKIRKSVQDTYLHLTRGLATIRALVNGNAEELTARLVELVRLLLNGVVKLGGPLVGSDAVETYLDLGMCVADRLESVRAPLAIATLRALEVNEVPANWTEEPLEDLVSRVLYRLRYATEKEPLLPSSFAYCFPLIHFILENSGVVGADKKASDAKDVRQEQVQIAVDIVSFHCMSGESESLPRQEMIASLLSIIKEYPHLAKIAKTSLGDLTRAMGDTTSLEEIEVLLKGLLYNETLVRQATLAALEPVELTVINFSRELWVACYDSDENNAKMAFELWEDNGMEVEPVYADDLLPLIVHDNAFVRDAAGKAIAGAVKLYPDTVTDTLNRIYALYADKAQPIVPQYNEFGLVIQESLNKKDPSDQRLGLAHALKNIAPMMTAEDLKPFANFLIRQEALGDRNADVRQGMLDAGLAMINAHGPEHVHSLIPEFEAYLSEPAHNSETHDRIRESAVVLFGALARHLDASSPKIPSAVEKLIETLKTPSEPVQVAVANCLPGLIKSIPAQVPSLLKRLTDAAFHSPKYAERRGAAYGLAGVIKGRGISSLKEFSVMATLKAAIDDKKDPHAREGAMLAFETLSLTLGRLFEPYVIQILPLLLVCFGDPVADVRHATSDTSRAIMGKLSGHCVKLIMPSLLAGLDDRQWRTKKGSVELLGSMAFLAPKQLSISLPTIIPRLSEVLTDSHTAVQDAARLALTQFGEVISNPEIQDLVPIMMAALCDPNVKTHPALTALLGTSFVHYIDAPSLALVMPILERGLRERATDIKKKASQIVGNMASLTDQKDLIPYLPRLLPGVKEVLVDPVPEARATAAKALGTLVEKLGEHNFPELVHELLSTLKSDTSGVDRQGAAQGLSEVLAGLGLERLEGLLPEIIVNTDSAKAYIREGFISLLVYLPATFGQRFQPYLGRIIPPILMGLADESEYVREASMRAGQMIISNYATKAVDLLLPELERGLFDDNWRIRQASVQLVGDLLFRITGTSRQTYIGTGEETADADADEEAVEEYSGADATRKKLLEVLGRDRRDRILASLYIVRADSSAVVRHASLTVWKSLVNNTPRMLREILSTMMTLIIRNLASSSYDRRMVAARTLGDMVRKLGEAVLSEIIPILEAGLDSTESDTRQGVCIGLSEIMATAGKTHVADYVDSIIPSVRKALLDESPEVREAAAQAFDTLHQCVGPKAIDEILPSLLASLHTGDKSAYALEGLKEIMAVRSNVVFPVLIPTLIAQPITAFNARALGSLVSVAGAALNRRLTNILAALIQSKIAEQDEDTLEALDSTITALLKSIDNNDGAHTLMMMLFELVKSEDPMKRVSGCNMVATFCQESTLDISRYVADWIRVLVSLLDDRTHEVVVAALAGLNAVTRTVRKEDMEGLVQSVRRAIRGVGMPGVDLPGFCLPKGIAPLLPIFLQGLMNGSNSIREASALAIGDMIQRTSADALKPFVTQITGPLIRIVGDRHPGEVKSAILSTLSLLLQKVPAHLKPFLPQLQRTFIKSLTDTSSPAVRVKAAAALSILISLQSRVDPLVTELVASIKASEPGVRETVLSALESVVSKIGAGMGDVAKRSVIGVVMEGLDAGQPESMWLASAKVLGGFCKHQSTEDASYLVQTLVLGDELSLTAAMLAANAILAERPELLIETGHVQAVANAALNAIPNAVEKSSTNGVLVVGKMLMSDAYEVDGVLMGELVSKLTQALAMDIAIESKRLALVCLRAFARKRPDLVEPKLKEVVPAMMACVRERVIPIKLAAERALLFSLQLQYNDGVYQQYLGTIDTAASKQLVDYHRRILSKLAINERQRLENLHGGYDPEAEEEDAEVYAVGGLEVGQKEDE